MRSLNRRLPLALVAAVLATVALAAPAVAQEGPDLGDQWVLTGRAVVQAGETADNVVILNGDALIAGTVDGAVVAVNGDIGVIGRVDGDVTSLTGRVVVAAGARVDGDVVSQEKARIAADATVEGDVDRVRDFSWSAFGLGAFGVWLTMSVSTLILGLLVLLLAPGLADAARAVAGESAGRAVLWGIIAAIGIPIIAFVLVATIVGLPLGVAILLALVFVLMLAYVMSAYALGRRVARPSWSRWAAFLVGWGILRVIAIVPVLGTLVTVAAIVFGLGLLVVGLWRARSSPRMREAAAGA
jgi:hypothetical protein